jgi:hypothetical protein
MADIEKRLVARGKQCWRHQSCGSSAGVVLRGFDGDAWHVAAITVTEFRILPGRSANAGPGG